MDVSGTACYYTCDYTNSIQHNGILNKTKFFGYKSQIVYETYELKSIMNHKNVEIMLNQPVFLVVPVLTCSDVSRMKISNTNTSIGLLEEVY